VLPGVVTAGGGGVTTTELGAGAGALGGAVFTEHAPSAANDTTAVTTVTTFDISGSLLSHMRARQVGHKACARYVRRRGKLQHVLSPSHT